MKDAILLRKNDTVDALTGCYITNVFEREGNDYIGAMTNQSSKTDRFFRIDTSVDEELNIQWEIYPTDEP